MNLSSSEALDLMKKAEKLLQIRKQLHFKLVHQLETLDIMFNLAMMLEDIDKVGLNFISFLFHPAVFSGNRGLK